MSEPVMTPSVTPESPKTATNALLPVNIAGAGLAGSLMAVFMARRGYKVNLFERRADLRTADIAAGRSINLALSARGLAALNAVGLADAIVDDALPMKGRMMHAVDGTLTFQPYGQDGQAILSVSRRRLNEILLDAAEKMAGVNVFFEHKVKDVNLETGALTVTHDDVDSTHDAALTIGADGAFSAVRQRLQRTDRFSFSQDYLTSGYKELEIPPTSDGDFALDPGALHIWPRGEYMMIALPNPDRTFTCTLFMPFDGTTAAGETAGQPGLNSLTDEASVQAFFNLNFPDAVPLMPTLLEDFFKNPTGSLATMRCNPHHHGENVLLIGDAAHAVVPFYGQGMNASFEDCLLFDSVLSRVGEDIGVAVKAYSTGRIDDANAIADLAIANYEEMRSKVASPLFLAKKKLEKTLGQLFPSSYQSLYSMVSFSTIPYAEAVAIAARQDRALKAGLIGAALAAVGMLLL